MFSRNKKKKNPEISLLSQGTVLYHGPLLEIPLTEETILSASILFFNDPEPCYIHRGAVRARLTSELATSLASSSPDLGKLKTQTGLPQLDTVLYEEKTFSL